MSKYILNLVDFKVEEEFLQVLFKFDKDACIGLNKKKYRDLLCNEFLKQYQKTVNIKWGRDSGKSVTVELYCASKTCHLVFKLTQKKENITMTGNNVTMHLKSSDHVCKHEDEKLIRQLRGSARKEVALKVKGASVDVIRGEAIIDANKELLSKGNLQNIYTAPVLRKAASDLRAKNDLSNDPIYDLFLQSNELKCVHSIEFKFVRFNINLLSSEQIEILKGYISSCSKNSQVSRIHYDATGGILAKPHEDIKNLLHHTIVIPAKFSDLDEQGSFLNIGEMISSLHTSDQQEIFLRRFLQLASKQIDSKGEITSL